MAQSLHHASGAPVAALPRFQLTQLTPGHGGVPGAVVEAAERGRHRRHRRHRRPGRPRSCWKLRNGRNRSLFYPGTEMTSWQVVTLGFLKCFKSWWQKRSWFLDFSSLPRSCHHTSPLSAHAMQHLIQVSQECHGSAKLLAWRSWKIRAILKVCLEVTDANDATASAWRSRQPWKTS